jgi:hypothetical protein
MRRWWRGFRIWLSGIDISLAVIPLAPDDDPMAAIKRVRKGLRDVRDRTARDADCWQSVAFAGMLSEHEAMVLVQHARIDREEVGSILARRWPGIVISNVRDAQPSSWMTVAATAALARKRRGIEPIRIIVPAQVRAALVEGEDRGQDRAMPFVF